MSTLTFKEKQKLEKLLGMASGHVLNFTDRTFHEFALESTGKDIYEEKYRLASGSKANCLRGFWKEESDHIVGQLLRDLLEYYREEDIPDKESLTAEASPHAECCRIAERLLRSASVPDLDAIRPNADGREFESVARLAKESIEKDEPEAGIDRLHTFMVQYVRVLCDRHYLEYNEDKPLHSLFGEYLKELRKELLIQTEMTERILKSSISILESFSTVRNRHSFAHPNDVLDRSEALLIYNNICSLVRFLSGVEKGYEAIEAKRDVLDPSEEDIPF